MIPTDDQLVGALDLFDVPFLTGGVQDEVAHSLTPAELLQGLAQSSDARVRSAIIPLLLRHPEFAPDAQIAESDLQDIPHINLVCFYTAAILLQKKYPERLAHLFGTQPTLPDLFSDELKIEFSNDAAEALRQLGERNAVLRGLEMNWAGGYEHAARTWLGYVELRAERRKKRAWQTV